MDNLSARTRTFVIILNWKFVNAIDLKFSILSDYCSSELAQ